MSRSTTIKLDIPLETHEFYSNTRMLAEELGIELRSDPVLKDMGAFDWFREHEHILIKYFPPIELAFIEHKIRETIDFYSYGGELAEKDVVKLTIQYWD